MCVDVAFRMWRFVCFSVIWLKSFFLFSLAKPWLEPNAQTLIDWNRSKKLGAMLCAITGSLVPDKDVGSQLFTVICQMRQAMIQYLFSPKFPNMCSQSCFKVFIDLPLLHLEVLHSKSLRSSKQNGRWLQPIEWKRSQQEWREWQSVLSEWKQYELLCSKRTKFTKREK